MTKTDLIAFIATETGLPKRAVEDVIDAQARNIRESLKCTDAGIDAEAILPGLGKLKTTTRAARTGRNPQTGAPVAIPARVAIKFSASKALIDALNS